VPKSRDDKFPKGKGFAKIVKKSAPKSKGKKILSSDNEEYGQYKEEQE
jgi:hypothetical protein